MCGDVPYDSRCMLTFSPQVSRIFEKSAKHNIKVTYAFIIMPVLCKCYGRNAGADAMVPMLVPMLVLMLML